MIRPVLSLGFRPFYLLASLFAIIAMFAWLLSFTGRMEVGSYFQGVFWHSHEMVFGFIAAGMTGFLFTAVRNWTGLPTPTGTYLAAIALLWLFARLAFYFGSVDLGVIVDVLFLPVVTVAVAIPIYRSSNQRNYKVVTLLAFVSALHIVFHLALSNQLPAWLSRQSLFATIDLIVIIFALVGGRVIPAFTRNAVPDANPTSVWFIDALAFGTLILIAMLSLGSSWLPFSSWLPPALLLVAAAAHLVRLALWQPHKTLGNPLLWMLPVAYAWLPVGLFLRALAGYAIVVPGAWIHALTAGALSSMMLAMMIRSSLGHTGRALLASRVDMLAFLSLQVAAILRVFAGTGDNYRAMVVISGIMWTTAFLLFGSRFLPVLIRPRLDAKSS